MKKRNVIILLIILTILSGVFVGIILANRKETSNIELESETKLAKTNEEKENLAVQTASIEEKTSPNCEFVFETYFRECKHITEKKQEIPQEYINKTEEDLQEPYRDYKIKEFTPQKVIFYEEKDGICNEHYIVKENNGYIAIYNLDNLGKETLKETTGITTLYLPETDKIKLQEGIKIIGKEELNACIEDYE